MKISHIEHLGIAVQSIEDSLPFFTDVLGLECYATEVVEDQKVKTAFLTLNNTSLDYEFVGLKRYRTLTTQIRIQ